MEKREREREGQTFRRYFCRENMEAYRCGAGASPLQSDRGSSNRARLLHSRGCNDSADGQTAAAIAAARRFYNCAPTVK